MSQDAARPQAPLDGAHHIRWNSVSSSKRRIKQAKEDWQSGRSAPVSDEVEFIPRPESGPVIMRNSLSACRLGVLQAALKNHDSSGKKCGKNSHLQKHRDFFLRADGFSIC